MVWRNFLDLWQIWMGLGPFSLEESQHDRNIVDWAIKS